MNNIITKSAKDIILNQFDKDELQDIAQHGCASCALSGYTYYYETTEFFDTHKDEIESYIEEIFGSNYLAHFCKEVCDITQLKNCLVWAFIELVASEEIN